MRKPLYPHIPRVGKPLYPHVTQAGQSSRITDIRKALLERPKITEEQRIELLKRGIVA